MSKNLGHQSDWGRGQACAFLSVCGTPCHALCLPSSPCCHVLLWSALLWASAFTCCDPWTLKTVLLGVPHLFTLSSLNLLRPQAVLNTEQTLFHRNEFILLTHTLIFWRMVIAVYIMIWVYNKLYFRLLLIQRGNPNEVWWIEMEVKWIKNFPKNHSLAQFGINIMTSAFLWFVFVSPLTYRFSEISF